MDLRPRSACKRRSVTALGNHSSSDDSAVDESDSNFSCDEGEGDNDDERAERRTADEESWGSSARSGHSSLSGPNETGTGVGADQEGSAGNNTASPMEERRFNSWEDFHAYIGLYQAQTFQNFRVRTNNKVVDRNAKIKRDKSSAPLIPEEWDQYAKTLVCTHAGEYKSRGQGKRPRQEVRTMSCKAQINACVRVIDKTEPTFAICITKESLVHNHALSQSVFQQYSSNRTAIPRNLLDTVDTLRKAGAKKKSILQFITENSDVQPSIRDVHNLVQKLKNRDRSATTSAARLKRWMLDFCEEPGNVGRVFVDRGYAKKVATCITMQTKHMREMYERFPEVLLIDATHGTNASKYKIFSFMVHDVFGKGQFVQHAAVQNERRSTLLTAIEEFKSNNPAWTKLQCIVIDKDFTEMSVLKSAFPNVVVLLCQFHVLKYLREEVASAEYGLSPWQKSQLRSIFNLMVYAKTEREYLKHHRYMVHILSVGVGGLERMVPGGVAAVRDSALRTQLGSASGSGADDYTQLGSGLGTRATVTQTVETATQAVGIDGDGAYRHPFQVYFDKNWDSCRELWCSYKRQNAVTVGNNTNNRLESSWKQLKDTMHSLMGLDECIASIMYYQSREERSFAERLHKLTVVQDAKYDQEMAHIANLVSEHACELLYEQYAYALHRAQYTYYEPFPEVIYIKRSSQEDNDALDELNVEYSVNKRTWECSCLFMATRMLPCRHVLFLRKDYGLDAVIPTQQLHPRWLLSSARLACTLPDIPSSAFAVRSVIQDKTPWDSNRKYREANQIASSISDTLSSLGMSEFRVALKALHQVDLLFKRGQFDGVAQIYSESAELDVSADNMVMTSRDDVNESSACTDTHSGSHSEQLESQPEQLDSGSPQLGPRSEQLGPSSEQLGPSSEQLGSGQDQLGSGCEQSVELGVRPVELGICPVESESGRVDLRPSSQTATSSGLEVDELNPQDISMNNPSPVQPGLTGLAPIRLEDDDFAIASPVRAKGRPKQKPKAKKARRNLAIEATREDSEMHEDRLSLETISELEKPTFASSARILKRFKMFEFEKKPKAPIAHVLAAVPANKSLTRSDQITRVFPLDLLRRCDQKVTALQKAKGRLAERDVAVEIPQLGLYGTDTLGIMRRWHQDMKKIRLVDKALKWLATVDLTATLDEPFEFVVDAQLPSRFVEIPFQSSQIDVLDLAGKGCLSDTTIHTLLKKLYGGNPSVIVVDPANYYVTVRGKDLTAKFDDLQSMFEGVSTEKMLIPINCSLNHWCVVLIDLATNSIHYYDPMCSSYKVSVRLLAQRLSTVMPRATGHRLHIGSYEAKIGVQIDSYNCGVYVLLACEVFCGASSPGDMDRKMLQCMRYRYMCMCV